MRYIYNLKNLVLFWLVAITTMCSDSDDLVINSFEIDSNNSLFTVIDTVITGKWILSIDLNNDEKNDFEFILPDVRMLNCDWQPCDYIDFKGALIFLYDSISFLVEEEMDTIFQCLDDENLTEYTDNSDYKCDSCLFYKVYKIYSPKLFNSGDVVFLNSQWYYMDEPKHEFIMRQFGSCDNYVPIVYKEKLGHKDNFYDETVSWVYDYIYGRNSTFQDKYIIYKILNKNAEWKYGWIKINLEDYSNIQITQISYQN